MSITVTYSTDRTALDTHVRYMVGHSEKNTLLIVPEQHSMSAEIEFSSVTKGGFEVISFRRLCKKIYEAAGSITGGYVSSSSKVMLMQRALDTEENNLRIYGKCAQKPGFAAAMVKTVSEFKHAAVTVDTVIKKADEASGVVQDKLTDFAGLFSLYNSMLLKVGADCDDDLTLSLQLLRKNPKLYGISDSMIIIDKFNGFTMQEKLLIRFFAEVASVHVLVMSDSMDDDASVCFASTVNDIKRLTKNLPATFEKLEEDSIKSDGQMLAELYFKYPAEESQSDDIKIFYAKDAYSEVCGIAAEIMRLCREEGYRYRDFAIVYQNQECYCPVFERVFDMFKIPLFNDRREAVSDSPLISFITAIGDVFEYNYSYDSIANLIKSTFSPVSDDEADIFENFILEYGVYGKHFTDKSCWEQKVGYAVKSGRYDKELLDKVWLSVIKPLILLREKTKGAHEFSYHAKALFDILCEFNVYKKIESITEDMKLRGNISLAGAFSGVWNTMIGCLDEIVSVMGDEKGSFAKFMSSLGAGLGECTIGVIPPVVDCVTLTSGERFVGGNIKVLFAVGVNSGEFPPMVQFGGMFDGTDRDILEGLGIELTNTRLSSMLACQQILHKIFYASSGLLYFTYRNANADGTATAPSEVIYRIKSVFPNIKEREFEKAVSSPLYTYSEILAPEEKQTKGYESIRKWFLENAEWKEKLCALKSGVSPDEARLSKKSLDALYKNGFLSSVSRLEKYGGCAFSYFVQYNLKANPRKVYKIGTPDIGSLVHNVLEESAAFIDKNYGWTDITPEICNEITEKTVEKQAPEFLSGMLLSSPRYRYALSKASKLISKNLYYIARQFSHSMFRPSGYEISFGSGGESPIELVSDRGETIRLTGKVDRCDVLERDGVKYLRIIDYKTGEKELKLSDVYNGLNLQLLTYLDALCEEDKKPAGVLYFKVTDRYDRMKNLMDDKLLRAYLKGNYRMSGLVLNNRDVLLAMDDELGSIKVKEGKDGFSGDVASESEIEILRKGVKNSIKKLSSEILSGIIDINPVSDRKPCIYCDFKNICRNTTGCKKIKQFKNDQEVYETMLKEQSHE